MDLPGGCLQGHVRVGQRGTRRRPDAGACAPRLPADWPAAFAPWGHNSAMVPTSTAPLQGSDNVYAPDLHAWGGAYVMWYGGQGGDGHDRIDLASSRDAAE